MHAAPSLCARGKAALRYRLLQLWRSEGQSSSKENPPVETWSGEALRVHETERERHDCFLDLARWFDGEFLLGRG